MYNSAPSISTDGKLEYYAFDGGYFDPDKGTMYYPYGEPTIEPTGQRCLFGGKEREHAGGRNIYDFGARCLTPYGRWGVVDSESEGNMPGNNKVQNKQVDQLAKKYGLNEDQTDELHRLVGGQGYGYHEIEELILDWYFR